MNQPEIANKIIRRADAAKVSPPPFPWAHFLKTSDLACSRSRLIPLAESTSAERSTRPGQFQDQAWLGASLPRYHRAPSRAAISTLTAVSPQLEWRRLLRHLLKLFRSTLSNIHGRVIAIGGAHLLGSDAILCHIAKSTQKTDDRLRGIGQLHSTGQTASFHVSRNTSHPSSQ